MADLKISELSALAGANLVAADELAIVDDSASETKKITVSDLIANGVTLISDDTIPGAKILFAAGDIATAALADSAVATAKVADDAITSAKLADESTVDLVTTLPASGAFTGQLALDTDDNSLYAWDGSAWQSIAAPASVNTVSGSTTGEINIVATTSGSTVTISATIDDTASAAQFLAGPTGSGGTVGYRTIVGTDLPVATTSAKGGVIVNGNGLVMDGDTIEIDNTITSSATHHVVTYDANGLITGGRVITSADLPFATETTVGAVSVGDGLAVGAAGELSVDNTVTPGEYTKVTVTAQGLVSSATTLAAADIPDHSAAKLTSGTIGTSLIANDAITADKMADQSTVKFGGALGSDNVTIFPTGDFKGQMFWDETSEDLYIYSGSAFVPITVLSGNLVNAGAYDASTNTMSSVTTAGSSAGFSAGAALPAPAASNLNHYVVVDTSGTGSGAAPAVALAPPDMLLSQGVGTEYALIDVSNAIAGQTASNISFIASGNIAATDVQAALQEVDTEKLAKAGDTMTGALGIGTASSIVFEGSTADNYETTLTVTDPTADRTITFPDVTGNVVTTGDTGTVTSTMILDGTIVNADINASAEIAVSKLADGAARQLLQTDAAGTGVEWASNIDIPGTLDVTSTATFDSTVTVTGLITANGKVSFPAGTAAAPGLYSGTDIDTGIYAPAANQFGITTAGTAALTIDASQRVGVGTTSPFSDAQLTLDNGGSGDVAIALSRSAAGQNDAAIVNSGGEIVFKNGFSSTVSGLDEAVRIDTSRRLLVGTTSSSVSTALVVQGNSAGSASGQMYLQRNNNTPSSGNKLADFNFADSSGNRGASISTLCDGTWTAGSFHPGALVFSTTANGASSPTERMRIDSSGKVGIGQNITSSLGYELQITDKEGTDPAILGLDVSGNDARLTAYGGSGGTCEMAFRTQNAGATNEKMRIDSSGRLLVGTSSSTYNNAKLQVAGSNSTSYISMLNTSASDSDGFGYNILAFRRRQSGGEESTSALIIGSHDGTGDDQKGRLVFGTNDGNDVNSPTERMRIDSSGNVGIGLTNISGSGSLTLVAGQSYKFAGSGGNTIYGDISADTSHNITFKNNNGNERMRIDSSGRLLVGTSSVVTTNDIAAFKKSGSSVVSVQTSTDTNNTQAYFGAKNSNGTQDAQIGVIKRNNNDMVGYIRLDEEDGVGQFLWVDNAGNFRISTDSNHCGTTSGAVVGTQTSDERLKNIGDAVSYGLSEIKQLQPKQYALKSNSTVNKLGFIAQEVESIIPEAVFDTREELENHQQGDRTKLGMEYVQLIPVLVNAVKELSAENDALKQRLTDAGL